MFQRDEYAPSVVILVAIPAGPHGRGAFDGQLLVDAAEAQAGVANERPGQQAGLAEHLKAVADTQHRQTAAGGVDHGPHDGRLGGDGAGAQVVAVGEPAGDDDGVHTMQVGIGMPERDRFGTNDFRGTQGVDVIETAGEGDDADPDGHRGSPSASRVTVHVSMTGFARTEPASCSSSSSVTAPSTSSSKCLPARTSVTPAWPDRGERGLDRLALRVEDLRFDDDIDCHAGHGVLLSGTVSAVSRLPVAGSRSGGRRGAAPRTRTPLSDGLRDIAAM
jgi:hypothetical protein